MPDDYRALEPPDPIPNSDVKRCIADGSVGLPHVRVGHRQASIMKRANFIVSPFFMSCYLIGILKFIVLLRPTLQ